MITFDQKKQKGTVKCDECGETQEFHGPDICAIADCARAVGWIEEKHGMMKENYCRKCG